MRPGQTAPEFRLDHMDGSAELVGFNEAGADCPGIHAGVQIQVGLPHLASMRPGQTAPEFAHGNHLHRPRRRSFNEAGADCPGIQRLRGGDDEAYECFNEAGADCPGIRCLPHTPLSSNGRASMRPGQTAPEFFG